MLPKVIYKVKEIPSTSNSILHRIRGKNPDTYIGKQNMLTATVIPRKKRKEKRNSTGITIADFKPHYKAIMIKSAY